MVLVLKFARFPAQRSPHLFPIFCTVSDDELRAKQWPLGHETLFVRTQATCVTDRMSRLVDHEQKTGDQSVESTEKKKEKEKEKDEANQAGADLEKPAESKSEMTVISQQIPAETPKGDEQMVMIEKKEKKEDGVEEILKEEKAARVKEAEEQRTEAEHGHHHTHKHARTSHSPLTSPAPRHAHKHTHRHHASSPLLSSTLLSSPTTTSLAAAYAASYTSPLSSSRPPISFTPPTISPISSALPSPLPSPCPASPLVNTTANTGAKQPRTFGSPAGHLLGSGGVHTVWPTSPLARNAGQSARTPHNQPGMFSCL